MKVVAHNGAAIFGGAEIAVCRLLSGMADRGHDVVLYCSDTVVEEGARRHGLRVGRLHLGGDAALHHAARWARVLGRERPDAVLITTFRKLWLGSLGAWLAGASPVVARIGLESDVPRNAKYRFVFRHLVDRIVCNAEDLRRRYREILPDLPYERLVTVYKGFDPLPRERTAAAVRRALDIPEDSPVVGAIGRLDPQKRFDRLLRAATRLGPDVHLLVVGGGERREELERLSRELGLETRVRFTGHRDDVGDLLAVMDVLAVTSDRESLANVMLEALAAGVPVVSTPVSGAREALEPAAKGGVAPGRVVPVDPRSIAEALHEILRDADLRARMGAAARRRAETRFSQEAMLDGWEEVLR